VGSPLFTEGSGELVAKLPVLFLELAQPAGRGFQPPPK